MKKTLYINLLLLIFFSFSLCLYSQTGQDDLDQAKLMKQQIGTWKADISQDTIVILEFTQAGAGFYVIQELKAKGKTYETTPHSQLCLITSLN